MKYVSFAKRVLEKQNLILCSLSSPSLFAFDYYNNNKCSLQSRLQGQLFRTVVSEGETRGDSPHWPAGIYGLKDSKGVCPIIRTWSYVDGHNLNTVVTEGGDPLTFFLQIPMFHNILNNF